jgi:hypothetical protein
VRLRDAAGKDALLELSSPALTLPVNAAGHQSLEAPHALALGASIRLAAFAGVDLRRIISVELVGLRPGGDITVADVSFER